MAKSKFFTTRKITTVGLLTALIAALHITIGYIPTSFLAQITIMHIPVILGAILEGPAAGGVLGLFFGLSSLIFALTTGNPMSVFFMNPLVSVVPRILIGVVSYYIYKAVKLRNGQLRAGIAAAAGTLTNTLLVFLAVYLLFFREYSALVTALGGACLVNVGPEVAVSVIICVPIVMISKRKA